MTKVAEEAAINSVILSKGKTCTNADMADGGYRPEDVAARLIMLRKVLGFENQNAFAARIGFTQSQLNHYESARRMINIPAATRLCARTGVTLDWIYRGDRAGLSVQLSNLLPDLDEWKAKQAG